MRHKTGNGHNVGLEQLLEDIKVVVRDGEELLKAGATGLKERALTGARFTNESVRTHPYQTIGIVFGIGFLAGLMVAGMFVGEIEREED